MVHSVTQHTEYTTALFTFHLSNGCTVKPKCTCRYACSDCMTFRITKLAHAQQHDVHIPYTELLPNHKCRKQGQKFTYVRS